MTAAGGLVKKKGVGFAIWLTGLPASGKSTVAHELERLLAGRGLRVERIESDEWRKVLTPAPRYDDAERDAFYGSLASIGERLCAHGVAVIFDATANRARYRDAARSAIPRFIEVFVDTPVEICRERDPKGIYMRETERRGTDGTKGTSGGVPGFTAPYEAPGEPEVTIRGDIDPPLDAATRIVRHIEERGWIA